MRITVTAIEGNRQRLDGGAMFGNAPKALWQRWLVPDADNRIELACRCLLIETPGYKILCETGIGAFFPPKLAERYGIQMPTRHLLLENLTQLGIQEADIDMVILSHLHFDHAGGLLSAHGDEPTRLLFPNATYVVGTEAFARSVHPHVRDKASFIPELPQMLLDSQRLLQIAGTGDKVPGPLGPHLQFLFSHGHTPGHMHTLVKGDRQQVFFCGDLIPGINWLHLPITMGYDRFPEKLIEEKGNVHTQACAEKWFLFYTHDPEISMSRCQRGDANRVEAIEVQPHVVRWEL